MTKFDIKNKWNLIFRDEIEKKSIKKMIKKIAIKRIGTKFEIKIK
jgi:hypothetical protein